MTTNTIVLIVVAIVVALAMAGIVAGVTYKFRADRRALGGAGILDEAEAGALMVQREAATKAQVAQVDSGINAFRRRGRRKESADARTTADMRQQLKDRSNR